MFVKQYLPAGQGLQVSFPRWPWYVPDTHDNGVSDPIGHLLPVGHSSLLDIVGFAVPLGQK